MFRNIFERPRKKYELFKFTDCLEIYCLSQQDKSIRKTEYEKILRLGKDFNPEDIEEDDNPDRYTMLCNEIFKDVNLRINTYGSSYPFIFDEDEESIKLKSELNNEEKLYIVLLITSNLSKLESNQNYFTSFLEIVSFEVVQELFPNADTRLFGSSNSDHALVGHFESPKLKDRIQELSNFINQPCKNLSSIRDNNLGDNGLDIIAMIPTGDTLSSKPLFFIQCASSNEDWVSKQHETSRSIWSPYLEYNDTSVLHFIFIPQSYRNLANKWFSSHKIQQSVLFDRLRICKNVSSYDRIDQTNAFKLVDHFLNNYE